MIDFPIADLFDDSLCLLWLERHLHPDGFVCPHCGSANRRLFRRQGHYDAYRCRDKQCILAFAKDLQPSRVTHDVLELVLGVAGERERQSIGTSAERTVTGDRQLAGHQVEHRLGKALGESGRKHTDSLDPPRRWANQARPWEVGQ
jgi:hypothetical protein